MPPEPWLLGALPHELAVAPMMPGGAGAVLGYHGDWPEPGTWEETGLTLEGPLVAS